VCSPTEPRRHGLEEEGARASPWPSAVADGDDGDDE
jgi:hypothetical protein